MGQYLGRRPRRDKLPKQNAHELRRFREAIFHGHNDRTAHSVPPETIRLPMPTRTQRIISRAIRRQRLH